jgi:tetratricopeptide (TPR) repeat protein
MKILYTLKSNVFIAAIIISLILGMSSCGFMTNKKYKEAVETADNYYKNKKYKKAKISYNEALKLKPEEKYPKEQIKKIDSVFAKLKLDTDYKTIIKKGDVAFNNKEYKKAKSYFNKASSLKKDEQYPKEMLGKINNILAEIAKQEEISKYPYHIVVGCFTIESNATQFNEKLTDEGKKSRIISLYGGKYNAVTIESFPDLTSAYNELSKVKSEYGEQAWVLNK